MRRDRRASTSARRLSLLSTVLILSAGAALATPTSITSTDGQNINMWVAVTVMPGGGVATGYNSTALNYSGATAGETGRFQGELRINGVMADYEEWSLTCSPTNRQPGMGKQTETCIQQTSWMGATTFFANNRGYGDAWGTQVAVDQHSVTVNGTFVAQ